MSKQWSSFENDGRIMEAWRDHLDELTELNEVLEELNLNKEDLTEEELAELKEAWQDVRRALKGRGGIKRAAQQVGKEIGRTGRDIKHRLTGGPKEPKPGEEDEGDDVEATWFDPEDEDETPGTTGGPAAGGAATTAAAADAQPGVAAAKPGGAAAGQPQPGTEAAWQAGKLSNVLKSLQFLKPEHQSAIEDLMTKILGIENIVVEAAASPTLRGTKSEKDRIIEPQNTKALMDLIGGFGLNPEDQAKLVGALNNWGLNNTIQFKPAAPGSPAGAGTPAAAGTPAGAGGDASAPAGAAEEGESSRITGSQLARDLRSNLPRARQLQKLTADDATALLELIDVAIDMLDEQGSNIRGAIGTAWNRNLEKMKAFNQKYQTTKAEEEMEEGRRLTTTSYEKLTARQMRLLENEIIKELQRVLDEKA